MSADLIQRLRTCSTDERRAVAIELARTRTSEAVRTLIQMADGVKTYERDWRTLWFRTPVEYYDLDDQLIAITALAEGGTQRGSNYLRKLYSPVKEYGPTYQEVDERERYRTDSRDVYVDFPHAKGALRDALRYEAVEEQNYAYYDKEWSTNQSPYEKPKNKNLHVHEIVESALRKAEATVSIHPA